MIDKILKFNLRSGLNFKILRTLQQIRIHALSFTAIVERLDRTASSAILLRLQFCERIFKQLVAQQNSYGAKYRARRNQKRFINAFKILLNIAKAPNQGKIPQCCSTYFVARAIILRTKFDEIPLLIANQNPSAKILSRINAQISSFLKLVCAFIKFQSMQPAQAKR